MKQGVPDKGKRSRVGGVPHPGCRNPERASAQATGRRGRILAQICLRWEDASNLPPDSRLLPKDVEAPARYRVQPLIRSSGFG
jgi:hypothetical protein